MYDARFGRVSELFYTSEPGFSLPKLVHELGMVLERIDNTGYKLGWDCDDIATFDMPGCRILLALAQYTVPDFATQLLIGVGPSPIPAIPGHKGIGHAALCHRIASRIMARAPADGRRDRSLSGVLTPDMADDILFSDARKMADKAEWAARQRAKSAPEAPDTESLRRVFRKPGAVITLGPVTEQVLARAGSLTAGSAAYVAQVGDMFSDFLWVGGDQLPR